MSVEWMRSCYASTWQLFRNDAGLTTRGRYYFSPPGTPFYPGFHNLGSRRWHDANWTHVVNLGEQLTPTQEWDRGRAPAAIPFPRLVGNADCIASGEQPTDAIDPAELINGFPPLCWVNVPPSEQEWARAASVDRCSLQRFYARMIELLYEDQEEAITDAFRDLLGNEVTTTVHRGTDLMPAVTTIIGPHYAIAVVDGTRNFQQFAEQAMTSVQRPTDRGMFGTVPLWWTASQWVHDFLVADGADPTKPILFAGHSYGAATCLVLAARYRHARPERRIRAITYGCPKPGDQRLIDLVERCETTNLANDNDFITVFPPDRATLLPVMIALNRPDLIVWDEWKRAPSQLIQADDGSLSPGPPVLLDFSTLFAIAQRVIERHNLNAIVGHSIPIYVQRIETRCRNPEWPVSEEVIDEWEDTPMCGYLQIGGELIRNATATISGGVSLGGLALPDITLVGGVGLGGELIGEDATLSGGVDLGGVDLGGEDATISGGVGLGGLLIDPYLIEGGLRFGGHGF